MRVTRHELGAGGSEGSVVYFFIKIGSAEIYIAESRLTIGSSVSRKWVPSLDFLDEFLTQKDIEQILRDCKDDRLARFIHDQLGVFLEESDREK